MKVFVYWNLHKKCWSVRHKGKVIAHADFVTLKDVEWYVNENGRQRVIAKRKKEVHAGAKGTLEGYAPIGDAPNVGLPIEDTHYSRTLRMHAAKIHTVTYNPYKGPCFVSKTDGLPLFNSASAFLCPDREVFALGCN